MELNRIQDVVQDPRMQPCNRVLIIDTDSHVVDSLRDRFVGAFGFGPVDHPFFYRAGDISDVHFPTDYFDATAVVKADKPLSRQFCSEVFRVLKQEQKLYVPSGLAERFVSAGFVFNAKGAVCVLSKPRQKRCRILVPPGVGDVYWVLAMLRSFCFKNDLGIPDILVAYRDYRTHCGHKRSFGFIEMVPFVHSTWENVDYGCMPNPFWAEALGPHSKAVYTNVPGCDYFVALNGPVNAGNRLDASVSAGCEFDWNLPLFVSARQRRFGEQAKQRYGDYALLNFGFCGTYARWAEQFGVAKIRDYVLGLKDMGLTLILVGGSWDCEDPGMLRVAEDSGCEDLVGKTNVEDLFGLIRNARLCFGYLSGCVMVSPMLGTRTLSLASDHYPDGTAWNCVDPNLWTKRYWVANAKESTPESLLKKTKEILREP